MVACRHRAGCLLISVNSGLFVVNQSSYGARHQASFFEFRPSAFGFRASDFETLLVRLQAYI